MPIMFLMHPFVSFVVLLISFLIINHFNFVNMKSLMFIIHWKVFIFVFLLYCIIDLNKSSIKIVKLNVFFIFTIIVSMILFCFIVSMIVLQVIYIFFKDVCSFT